MIEVLLSDGWYRGQVGLPRAHDQWGTTLGLLAELRADGAHRVRDRRRLDAAARPSRRAPI